MNMKKGFTLVEVIFVMAIIAILAGMGISNMSGSTDTAENTAAKGNVKNYVTEAQLYYTEKLSQGSKDGYMGFQSKNEDVKTMVVQKHFCVESQGAKNNWYSYDTMANDSKIKNKRCEEGDSQVIVIENNNNSGGGFSLGF